MSSVVGLSDPIGYLRFGAGTLSKLAGIRLPRRVCALAFQAAVFAFSGFAAFLLRFDFQIPDRRWSDLVCAIPVWVLVKAVVYQLARLHDGSWTHSSVPDALRVLGANVAASAASGAAIWALAPPGFPRSVFFLDFLVCTQASAGAMLAARAGREALRRGGGKKGKRRALIYGAGEAGAALMREIRVSSRLPYDVRGFIDDDPRKRGMRVQMIPVLGRGEDIPAVAARRRIEEVLIAAPSATGAEMARMLDHCRRAGVRCRTVPSLAGIIAGAGAAVQVRDVALEDLLGRVPVQLETDAILRKVQGSVVMVTGAAGSIGSELCRQLARFNPGAIVGYEIAESPLFELEQEMRRAWPGVPFHAAIGSVQNRSRLAEVFEAHEPAIVYHAAAYKHVPLMESHIFEAVENNVLGTFTVASVAAEYRAGDFVMISSDKAVRPTNIMGLTKRVAETLVRSLQNGGTKFVSVRFGNVLGSNGSVVPIFMRQIAAGGPVTVTHPDMRRYFMTIPEAVQLVLQASTMGKGGEIFVLDMGDPVRIVDLARKLILLSGLRPGEDIKIEFTGVRPGEKLYEELSAYNEHTAPTYHEKIKIFTGPVPDEDAIIERIERIRRLCRARDARKLMLELRELVPEYSPSTPPLAKLIAAAGTSPPAGRAPARTTFCLGAATAAAQISGGDSAPRAAAR